MCIVPRPYPRVIQRLGGSPILLGAGFSVIPMQVYTCLEFQIRIYQGVSYGFKFFLVYRQILVLRAANFTADISGDVHFASNVRYWS